MDSSEGMIKIDKTEQNQSRDFHEFFLQVPTLPTM